MIGNKSGKVLISPGIFGTPGKKLLPGAPGPMLQGMMDRRSSPRRRLRDRIASRPAGATTLISNGPRTANLLLLVDDDLRETALALASIESFLERALEVIDRPDLTREELSLLAGDEGVLDRIDTLSENLASL